VKILGFYIYQIALTTMPVFENLIWEGGFTKSGRISSAKPQSSDTYEKPGSSMMEDELRL
jgi:hypothetical protein